MKAYRTKLILTCLVTLLPLVAGLLLWDQLPAQIATHFSSDGQADGWSGRAFAVLGLPLILLALRGICLFATLHDPKKANVGRKMTGLLFWIVPVLSCIVMGTIYGLALGWNLNPVLITNALLGVVFLVIGNYMGKTHQNYTVGIKLPWTLHSTENWNRTHRVGSRCFLAGGLLFLLNCFLQSDLLLLAVVLVCVLIPIGYSYSLYKRGI